jgi:hypothetical protein
MKNSFKKCKVPPLEKLISSTIRKNGCLQEIIGKMFEAEKIVVL